MAIRFSCAGCGANLNAPDAWQGKQGKCIRCGTTYVVQAQAQFDAGAIGPAVMRGSRENGLAPPVVTPSMLQQVQYPKVQPPAKRPPKVARIFTIWTVVGAALVVSICSGGIMLGINAGRRFVAK